MGMDQYFYAKTKLRESKGSTGFCSGMFPIAPDDKGMVEIGYLRKAYDQDHAIMELYTPEVEKNIDNDYYLYINKESCEKILERSKTEAANRTKATIDEEADDDGEYGTWMNARKWRDMVEFFTEALRLYNEDPEMELYYVCDY